MELLSENLKLVEWQTLMRAVAAFLDAETYVDVLVVHLAIPMA